MPPTLDSGAGQGADGERKQRVTAITAIFLVGTALALDLLQDLALFVNVIPALGQALYVAASWFISILAAIVFGIWFAILGVNYFTGKKAAMKVLIAFASLVVELVPFLDALPAITFVVVALIIVTKTEDAGMTGQGVLRTIQGAAQITRAIGIKGARIAARGVPAERTAENPRLTESARREQFLDLRAARAPSPRAGEDT